MRPNTFVFHICFTLVSPGVPFAGAPVRDEEQALRCRAPSRAMVAASLPQRTANCGLGRCLICCLSQSAWNVADWAAECSSSSTKRQASQRRGCVRMCADGRLVASRGLVIETHGPLQGRQRRSSWPGAQHGFMLRDLQSSGQSLWGGFLTSSSCDSSHSGLATLRWDRPAGPRLSERQP